jgi:protein-disulfide isomerase
VVDFLDSFRENYPHMALNRTSSSSNMFERFVPVLILASIALAFMVGVLWQKVDNLEKGGANTAGTAGNQVAPAPVQVDKAQIEAIFDRSVIKFGDKNSKVLFVEFSDPSCPYCHIAGGLNPELNSQVGPQFTLVQDGGTYVAPVIEMKKLVDEGKAAFAWLYFNGHGNGELATKALYCAYDAGKFWEAHDLLMTSAGYGFVNDVAKNDSANIDKVVDFLKSANVSGLKDCLASGKYDARLQEEMNLGLELGVSGTPGFFVNENNFAGAYSYTDIKATVDAALN